MTITLVSTSATRNPAASIRIGVDAVSTLRSIWDTTLVGHIDVLNARLGGLRSLRQGWDGSDGTPPSREAVNCLFVAADQLSRGREAIGASPHPDGYINVEWERAGVWRTARVWSDHIDLMIDDEQHDAFEHSIVELDATQLAQFLLASE